MPLRITTLCACIALTLAVLPGCDDVECAPCPETLELSLVDADTLPEGLVDVVVTTPLGEHRCTFGLGGEEADGCQAVFSSDGVLHISFAHTKRPQEIILSLDDEPIASYDSANLVEEPLGPDNTCGPCLLRQAELTRL